MKAMAWFWGAFMLFFALPFPCIIYFGEHPTPPAPSSALWALSLLATSLLLWLTLAYLWLDKLVLGPPRALLRVKAIGANGVRRQARIEHAAQTGVHVRGFAQWNLRLSFDNLSGTPITEQMQVIDSKPALQRFAAGHTLEVRLGREPGQFPNVVLDGAQPELNRASLLRRAAGLLVFIVLVGAAYVGFWKLQSSGLGWTFLTLGHPLLVCPFVLCLYVVALRVVLRLVGADGRGDVLKFRGMAAEAKVLGVRQTGTYLNEQPQVEFTLEYTDARGTLHQAKLRRFVAQIDLAHIPRDRTRVLYDPENPTTVRMEDGA